MNAYETVSLLLQITVFETEKKQVGKTMYQIQMDANKMNQFMVPLKNKNSRMHERVILTVIVAKWKIEKRKK